MPASDNPPYRAYKYFLGQTTQGKHELKDVFVL
jgi:hypothetical protein